MLFSQNEHPYIVELAHYAPLKSQLEICTPQVIVYTIHSYILSFQQPVELTPAKLIDTEDKLRELITELNRQNEIAVDLEVCCVRVLFVKHLFQHHSMRSFFGLTCLMQISTRTDDYIIDPFQLWSHMHLLNEPFTNPKIVKVDLCLCYLQNV